MSAIDPSAGKCPVMHGAGDASGMRAAHARMTTLAGGRSNRDWWPNQLNLGMLHQNPPAGNPMDPGFSYRDAVQALDVAAMSGVWRSGGTSVMIWKPVNAASRKT